METTAADMARAAGVDPKRFRDALRKAKLNWHRHNAAWTVDIGSERHRQLQAVLDDLTKGARPSRQANSIDAAVPANRQHSDEAYIIDLCDLALGEAALRQHKFDFLRGDPGKNGVGARLPVDAWYPNRNIVIEYREIQHVEPVAFFDRRQTVSGIGRGQQRALYDQRRRDVLLGRGICLIELNVGQFSHDRSKRLIRTHADIEVIRRVLLDRTVGQGDLGPARVTGD